MARQLCYVTELGGFRCLLQILSTSGDMYNVHKTISLYVCLFFCRIVQFYGLLFGPYAIYAYLKSFLRNFRHCDYYINLRYVLIADLRVCYTCTLIPTYECLSGEGYFLLSLSRGRTTPRCKTKHIKITTKTISSINIKQYRNVRET